MILPLLKLKPFFFSLKFFMPIIFAFGLADLTKFILQTHILQANITGISLD